MHLPDVPSRIFVKRIIGLPGDRIEVARVPNATPPCWQPTKVFIAPDGPMPYQMLCETELHDAWVLEAVCCRSDGTESATTAPATTPAASYFVLGDNRNR